MEGVDAVPLNASVNIQSGIRAFLAHYMEHLSSRLPDQGSLVSQTIVGEDNELDLVLDEVRMCRRLVDAFHAVPRPIHSLAIPHQQQQPNDDVEPEKQALGRDLKRLASDVDMLANDQRLQSVIRTVAGASLRTLRRYTTRLSSSNNDLPTAANSIDESLTTATLICAEKEMLALYIARILHGLATKAVPASAWKDNGAICWGQYKRFEFDSLLNMVLFQLNTLQN